MFEYDKGYSQLCVYVEEKMVVNLWKGGASSPYYGDDTITNIYSSGKSLESIALGMLFDMGYIDFSDKIVEHWPEFTGNGKDGISIADVMRHESGFAYTPNILASADVIATENIKHNSLGRIYE